MADLGAVEPEGSGAVDLESPDISVIGETRVDTGAAREGHAGSIEGALRDRVTGSESEFDPVALGGGQAVRAEGEAWSNLDGVNGHVSS